MTRLTVRRLSGKLLTIKRQLLRRNERRPQKQHFRSFTLFFLQLGKFDGYTDRQKTVGQVASVINVSVHLDEALHGGFVLDTGVVQAGVQHDDCKRQHVARV